jgi:hypothetical protein
MEMQYLHFFHLNIMMGKWGVARTNDHTTKWCVIGMKVKRQHNHLHDEMQCTFIESCHLVAPRGLA